MFYHRGCLLILSFMNVHGVSFYDFVSKLLPGTLLLGLIFPESFAIEKEQGSVSDFFIIAVFIVGAYVLGIVWEQFVRMLSGCLRRNECMLCRSWKNYVSTHTAPLLTGDIWQHYDEAYSLLMMNDTLGTVPRQEANESFLRNIWPLLVIWLLVLILFPGHLCENLIPADALNLVVVMLLWIVLILPVVWWRIQMQIYFAVWDNANWTLIHLTGTYPNR